MAIRTDAASIRGFFKGLTGEYVFLAICITGGLLIRAFFFDFTSGDFSNFIGPWYDFIASKGGFPALGSSFSDYTPPYLYLLTLAYYLGLKALPAAKLISVAADLVLAFSAFLIVKETTKNRMAAIFAAVFVFLAPTVILNGSMWGQSDSLYAACCLLSLYFLMKDRYLAGSILFGLALAIKLQAIFLAPFFLFLILKDRYPLRYLAVIPAMYLLLIIPALAAGRPAIDLLMIYPNQMGFYHALTWNAPSVYGAFPSDAYPLFVIPGSLFAVLASFILIFFLSRGPLPVRPSTFVSVSFITALLVPFLLPSMHERYFFLADVLSVLYACTYPKRFYVPAIMVAVSLFAYMPFLYKVEPVPIPFLSLVLFGLVLIVTGFAVKERYGDFPIFEKGEDEAW
jgi:Gpi18-like mannosyltransferase